MRRNTFLAVALLAVTAVALLPGTSSAQFGFGIGGRNWGVNVGNTPFYGGGFGYGNPGYWGGYPGGWGGGYPGRWGYNNPGFYGYNPGFYGYNSGFYGYAPRNSFGITLTPGVRNYGSYYTSPQTTYDYGSSGYSAGTVYGAGDTGYAYGAMAPTNAARLNVRVPAADAEVWVAGQPTQQRGIQREFVSPPLNPEKSYTYEVKARWTENGRTVERAREVPVSANAVATVDFTSVMGDETDRPRTRTDAFDGTERRGTDTERRDLDRGTTPGTGLDRGTTTPGTDRNTNPGTRTNPGTDRGANPGTGTNPGTVPDRPGDKP